MRQESRQASPSVVPFWSHIVTYGVLAVLSGCGDASEATAEPRAVVQSVPQDPAAEFRLVPVATFGESNRNDSTATLGKPRAVAEFDDQLLVLDSDWMKIFVYEMDGEFARIIGDGYGLRPGELALPVDMAVHAGHVYVVDYELKSVSIWDTDGRFRRVIDISHLRPRGIAVTSGGIYIRLMFPREGHWVARIDSVGEVVEYLFPLAQGDADFSDAGYGGALTASWNGTAAVYVHGTGAMARTHSLRGAGEVHLEPVPRLLTSDDGMAFAELAVYDAVALPEGRILVLRARREVSPSEDPGLYELALYDGDGTLVGSHPLPPGSVPLAIDRGTSAEIVDVSLLQPRTAVVRYRMEIVDG